MKPRRIVHSSKKQSRKAKKQQSVNYLLEVGTLESMKAAKQRTQDFLDYQWKHYSELAYQRNQKQEVIKKALISAAVSDFKFEKWQRAVKYKYSLHPLGTLGSISNIGGRFNTGIDVNSNVPSHAALYVAIDKDTALQETLGQMPDPTGQLTPQEVALTNPDSETFVAVSGYLEKVFDLRSYNSLNGLISIIKRFEFSDAVLARAKDLKIDTPRVIQTSKELLTTLLDKNWRHWPENLDVPSNSQVFGHLLYMAGLEGVIYPSKLTEKDCLAIFPHNFDKGSSYIEIVGDVPHEKIPRRIDARTWPLCNFNFDDFTNSGSVIL